MLQRRMSRCLRVGFLVWLALLLPAVSSAESRVVFDAGGETIRVLDANGNVLADQDPGPPPPPPGNGSAVSAAPAATHEPLTSTDPSGARVETDGTIVPLPGATAAPASTRGAASTASTTPRLTIDSMTVGSSYSETYTPASIISLIGRASVYTLSDGSTWRSGAGTYRRAAATLDRVEINGTTIRYVLLPPADGQLYQQTDYDAGNHSSQGVLGVAGPLIIEATQGATTATMRGGVAIVSNEITGYGEPRFNFFSAIVGAVVPFESTYRLTSGTWQPDTFNASFSYSYSGWVDFANPISVPLATGLDIRGSGQAPAESSLQYYATATYDNGATRNVTGDATWAVTPLALASVSSGLLQTGTPAGSEAQLELRVDYHENGVDLQATKPVKLVVGGVEDASGTWPTYQGNRGHTGHVPTSLEPGVFRVRWERDVAPGRRLSQVSAGDGGVFVSAASRFVDQTSLWALDNRDGEVLWSKAFGRASSVNPPALAYGNVYIQTGKENSSAMPPLLHAFDALTGTRVFQSTFAAQWESYLAPTVFDGNVYINGGYYGGMYAYDAFSGQSRWFANLPQYDDWTPAVDERHAYAYVGSYAPALYVHDRVTGSFLFRVDDPNFDWGGWSMNLAPVLGADDGVLAINDGRLIRFDVAARRIAWERQSSFVGQPSVRDGVIYAVDGGRLVACDEKTGVELWAWQPGGGETLRGEVLVTESHAFVATSSTTWAIEVLSASDVWSHPAGGTLSLGNETLYIASDAGRLTAIAMPDWTPATLVSVAVSGPVRVAENTTASFVANASYDDGRVRDRTRLTAWSVQPAGAATIDANGDLVVGTLLSPEVSVVVGATYEENGVVVTDEHEVELVISVSVDDFIRRNLQGAIQSNQAALSDLAAARAQEDAARRALEEIREGEREGPPTRYGAIRSLRHLIRALFWGGFAEHSTEGSIDELNESVESLDAEGEGRAQRRR